MPGEEESSELAPREQLPGDLDPQRVNARPFAPHVPSIATSGDPPPAAPLRLVLPLLVVFAALYFVQGIVEPTAGLLAQPLQSQLQSWGRTPSDIGMILAFIGIPWSLKPLFGLISDFLPLRGFRRRPYLVLSTSAAAAAFFTLAAIWSGPTSTASGVWLLLVACGAVAMTDVVIDALAVETGQPLGMTGPMQSVQWGAMSAATILAGTLGGFVAQRGLLPWAFAGCGLLAALSLVVVVLLARENRRPRDPTETLQRAWSELTGEGRLAILLSVGLYLFLWNFNPFSSNVLQHYSTQVLGFSEQFYGHLYSIQAAAQFVACIAYGFVCRRIHFRWLIHGSIVTGILATLAYWPMHDRPSAIVASIAFGLCYQTATLIQLDLAARVCPLQSAGTLFATLMAISNTGISAANAVSGGWYDDLTAHFGRHVAFDLLVAIGATFTAACWLVLPLMRWAGLRY